mgnify:CR=1 FL=1|tara:strand:- start:2231 stop:2869 length:639 start_codon:yes stop_codon:yes gene_type:complete
MPTINPTDDGWAGYQGGGDKTWATIRANSGNLKKGQADGTSEAMTLRMGVASGWDLMRRGQFVASASGVSGNIVSAKLRLYVNSTTQTLGSQSLVLCNGGPASTAIANSDYENNVSNTTVWGDSVTLLSMSPSTYKEWNFDATGIAGLQAQLGSNFKFQLRFESERANSEPGSFSSAKTASMNFNHGNAASNKSELVIVASDVVLGIPLFFT